MRRTSSGSVRVVESHGNGSAPPVAVVLPGGGGRGAYEAGALSILLPALEARGERIRIYCGTSVGAINAAFLASRAELSPSDQAEALVTRWRELRKGDLIGRVVGPRMSIAMLRFAGEALGLPGLRVSGLLDPAPMRDSLERWVDWVALHRNVRRSNVDAACVVATGLSSGTPVAFVHARRAPVAQASSAGLRYVRTVLTSEHVRASAAIPVLFPPVEVTRPQAAAGHYVDGATRLNHPIKPALALGAERVIVIGFEPFSRHAHAERGDAAPRMADVLANVLDGLLVDQVVDDVHRLAAVNAFLADQALPAVVSYRRARKRHPYRKIPYALVCPPRQGELGEIAERVCAARYGGLRALLDPDYLLLTRALGGRSRSRGELLSFLLFDPMFAEALIEAGQRDARAWLARHPNLWCTDPTHDLDLDEDDVAATREQETLSEWREMRRR